MELNTVNSAAADAECNTIFGDVRIVAGRGLGATRALRLTRQILATVGHMRMGLNVPRRYKRDAIRATWKRLREG